MKTFPTVCTCKSCECAIYTYEDSGVCKACNEGNHLSGSKRKVYDKNSSEITT
jgi:hypothetical protein